MSKLEDKLTASIKPERAQEPASATTPARGRQRKPAAKPAAGPGDAPDDLNAPRGKLHPSRIWPD